MRTSFRPAPLSEFAKAFQDLQNKHAPAALHFVYSGKKGKFALFKQNKHLPYMLSMKEEGKFLYETPATIVVEVRSEGVICQSLEDYNWNNPIEE